ncbi:alpha/beta hydrolase [Gordonia sp. PP30]|uniref:alpha/beta fold hydrolase n=1 Tax=unclassified Gordonia (in: high G+C Gram-positive bacteria) TaxID=2657482 RepID=UPI001FFF5D60|nr:alpha/beta hydrolase [Gordonia sp. PP30]UQE75467.1 alpha/beta hydrolase [Gordonia sp. PP30]
MSEISPIPFTLDDGHPALAGDRWIDDDAPRRSTLLLLHGGGQTRHSWDRSARALAARGHDVYTLDLRGHGDSEWAADGDYDLDAFAGDLLRVLGTLPTAPILIGASLGGITSLCVAGEHPDAAAGLVLVDVVVDVEPEGIQRIQNFMNTHLDGFATLDEVADAIAEYTPERKRSRNLDGLRKNVRQRADGRWYWHWDPAFMRDSDDEPRAHSDPERLGAAARNVTVPTLVVRGRQSDVVSEEGARAMLERIPHAELVDVGGAGHMVVGDDNQVFATAIDDFLESRGL